MKLRIEKGTEYTETEIIIHCLEVDERLNSLIAQIRMYDLTIPVKKEGRNYVLSTDSLYYFESVEEKTFAYQKAEVYECSLRLYELEERLAGTAFTRVGKACVLNTAVVEGVRPMLGGRLEALLENGERIVVSRHYVPAFKMKFGLGEREDV
ncbi:LytTR family transcriptional regulator [Kineothrix alysoides]|uniref:LytTR family transcriptional regulator n=1 Tax=Kineothrix alysoides TaxID=1469948 RepID=A0A4R1R370_9FIRM|nr:LytTR family DNA-binding domain-containing protein [Kineothrix alysoides]TCL59845.1 LytTR family transcriptional regulator [Kineothrix alysoides]